jgi:hypothetical protein
MGRGVLMSLDMFLYARKEGQEDDIRIGEWVKHHALHEHIKNLAIERSIILNPMSINCMDIELTKEDVLQILDLINRSIIEDNCFTDVDEHYQLKTIKYMRDAIYYIKDGYKIIYYCWY